MLWFTKQRNKKARNTLICLWGENFRFSDQIQGKFQPFPACFGRIGCRLIRTDMADTAQFLPNQPESKPIRHELSRVGTNRAESARIWKQKKKKTQTRHWCAGNRVGRGCSTLPAASVLSRGKGKIMKNKPLDRGSRRLRFVFKLHAQLRRTLWWWALVCGVVEVWAPVWGLWRWAFVWGSCG